MVKKEDTFIQIRTTPEIKKTLTDAAVLAGGENASLSGWLVQLGLAENKKLQEENNYLALKYGIIDPLKKKNRFDEIINKNLELESSDLYIKIYKNEDRVDIVYRKNRLIPYKEENISKEEAVKFIQILRKKAKISYNETEGYIQYSNDTILRFSIIESGDTTHLVIRILNRNSTKISETHMELLKKCWPLNEFTVFAGPTNSGKTTYAYELLKLSNLEDKLSVVSISEIIELTHKNIIQFPENSVDKFRRVMRIYPNVLYTGETSNEETINGINSAIITGIKVVSDIHAMNYNNVIEKLMVLGANSFTLGNITVVNLKKIQTLCLKCKIKIGKFYKKSKGCSYCLSDNPEINGYSGEIIVININKTKNNEVKNIVSSKEQIEDALNSGNIDKETYDKSLKEFNND